MHTCAMLAVTPLATVRQYYTALLLVQLQAEGKLAINVSPKRSGRQSLTMGGSGTNLKLQATHAKTPEDAIAKVSMS